MSVLWCGGEDIDYPNGATATVSTSASNFRSAYARCALQVGSPPANIVILIKGVPFPGGAVTSCWLTCRVLSTSATVMRTSVGFGLSGTSKCLMVGSDSATGSKLALTKYDGTTLTQLAAETGNSFIANVLHRLDVQLVNYGATSTVNVYWNGVNVISFSGDVTVSGVTNIDSIFIGSSTNNNPWFVSETVVADEDVRAWPGLMTLALTGAGNLVQWTNNTFSNINGTTINDANPVSDNTNAQKQEYNITDLAAGTYVIKAVKTSARLAKSASPAVTQVAMGFNHAGGTPAYGTGSTKTVTAAYATYEQLDAVDPVTGVAWIQGDMNSLQVNIEALT